MSPSTTTAQAPVPEQDFDIDDQVRQLLTPRKGEWELIAEQSGVSYSWISKFMNNHIPGPKVDTLKNLRAWLRANPPLSPSAPAAASTEPSGSTSSPGADLKPQA